MKYLESIQFVYPWVFLALPLPFLVMWLLPIWRNDESMLSVPFSFFNRLSTVAGKQRQAVAWSGWNSFFYMLCLFLVWIGLIIGLARPQWIGEPVVEEKPARDLLLAIDLSGSMATTDMKDANGKAISRLDAMKTVLSEFLSKRKGDRVGLLFFGSASFLQAPFTEDLDVCQQLLDEAQVGMAGIKTMLGDAMGSAIHTFQESPLKEKVLILLTDGNDTGSLVPPAKAAELANNAGIMVHTIAFGNPETAGEDKFDEKTLKGISDVTGGHFFMASDRESLAKVYEQVDKITPRKVDTVAHRPVHEMYVWPLFFALLLSFLGQMAACLKPYIGKLFLNPSITAAVLLVCFLPLFAGFSSGDLFHFLRPEAFFLLIPFLIVLLVLQFNRNGKRRWANVIDPHLLEVLLVNRNRKMKVHPVHVLTVFWLIGTVALAGPSFFSEASPQAANTADLVIVMKVTPSLEKGQDLQPNRLERAKQKVSDLLALRKDARNALIAYGGSSHLVMPLTSDATVLKTFSDALSPELIPVQGDDPERALSLAQKQLEQGKSAGSILFVADSFPNDFPAAVAQHIGKNGAPVSVLAMLSDAPDYPENTVDLNILEKAADEGNGRFESASSDKSDVSAIAAAVRHTDYVPGKGKDDRKDEGFAFMPLLSLVWLLNFRRGFTTVQRTA